MKKMNFTVSPLPAKTGGLSFFSSVVGFFVLLFAASVSTASANPPVQALESSDASYQIEDGVATIFGTAEDQVQKRLIERIVLSLGNVDEVRNELELMKPEREFDYNIGAEEIGADASIDAIANN